MLHTFVLEKYRSFLALLFAANDSWLLGEQLNPPLNFTKKEDGRIRKWSYVEETGKYLRVILLEDGEAVYNAFFDLLFTRETTT